MSATFGKCDLTACIACPTVSSGSVGIFPSTMVCEGTALGVCMGSGAWMVSMGELVPEVVGEAVQRSPCAMVVAPARLVGFTSRLGKAVAEQETDNSIRKRTNNQLMESL